MLIVTALSEHAGDTTSIFSQAVEQIHTNENVYELIKVTILN